MSLYPMLVTAIVCCTVASASPVQKNKPGEVYTSRGKIFRATVPEADNFAVQRFKVIETSIREKGELIEEAAFFIQDFGELYRVGVIQVTPWIQSTAERAEKANPVPKGPLLPFVLDLHFAGRVPGAVQFFEVEEVTTPLGPGVVATAKVDGGSRLVTFTLGDLTSEELEALKKGKMPEGKRTPGYVALVVVRRGDYLLYASIQNDFHYSQTNDDEKKDARKDYLRTKARDLLQSLKLLKEK